MPEDILHFIWKYRLYHTHDLQTISGKTLSVLYAGVHNDNAGADFLDARIHIGNTEWVGNVEIHVQSSDWNAHRHHHDKAYNNVILHVVYEYDKAISREDGTLPETLELKPLIPVHILPKYREMMSGMYWIPCEKLIHTVPSFQLSQWLSRLLVERFEHRVSAVYELLAQQRGSWEDTCYIWMARSFGFKVNAQAFELLTRVLPQSIVAKHKHRALAVEALFFGQAGMLEDRVFKDDYPQKLQQEYNYLRTLHSLSPMDASAWKFMRTRPSNFPSIRIAQFAALCLKSSHLFSAILDTKEIGGLQSLYEELPVNPYWKEHYQFDTPSSLHGCQFGSRSIDTILINSVAVILFAYGKYIGKEMYIYRAIALLESLKAEDNAVLRRFLALGIQARQAAESQALLQMKAFYCDKKKCLNCSVGLQLIKHNE
ncbi:DUF2851 family protein [Parapedobacter tibetensis]|uniref:DUF2851 family protein n=1 Tax=Parapedobacter tibetensis TaxID=2972951 RepID=UPI00214D907F|nr:DUF2851 family protein [Parapedobacter tibetensis]